MSSVKYNAKAISQDLMKSLGRSSIMSTPKLVKITLNMSPGKDVVNDKKILDHAISDLATIAAQKPITIMSKKSEAGFKIRAGWPIGCKVTLRKKSMYNFVQRFISIVCPKIRDFRGFSVKSFDGRGNLNIGIKEQIVFPEIRYDKIDKIRGLDIAITTTANTDEEAYALLKALNFPFRDKFKTANKTVQEKVDG